MAKPIVFFDIPGSAHPRKTWSPNTQKTRYSLNYKGLSYKTVWVEYPDIAALAKKIGAKPTATVDGEPLYTVPIIHDPNTGSVVADSFYIAQYLDKQYPGQPTLIPQDTDAFQVMFTKWFMRGPINPLYDLIVAAVNKQLNPRSKEYFRRTREQWEGGRLEELCPLGPKRKEKMEDLQKQLDMLNDFMNKNGEGKLFIMGDNLSFADFMLAGHMLWLKLFVSEDEWRKVTHWNDGRWSRHIEALKEWEEGVGDETELWSPE